MIARNLDAATGPEFKPRRQQLAELADLALRGHFFPEEYFLYRFGAKGTTYEHMLRYLSEKDYLYKVRWTWNANEWLLLAHNKWLFHLHYKAMGVPVSKVLGYYDHQDGCTITGDPLRSSADLTALILKLRPSSLVAKPVAGIQGKGVLVAKRLHYDNGLISCTDLDDRPFGLEKISAHLNTDHGVQFIGGPEQTVAFGGYLLEECAEDHPFCKEINPYTASVMRIVTFRGAGGEIEFDFASIRFGRKGMQAANWDAGGLSVSLDLGSGTLGRGVVKPKHGGGWHEVHPDTGIRFAGRRLPMWDEVLEACRRAARATPGLRSMGWDVILTASGPCIIEGNADWALPVVQVHSEGYLTPQIRRRLSDFGIQLPERLSRPSLAGLRMLLLYGHAGNALVSVAPHTVIAAASSARSPDGGEPSRGAGEPQGQSGADAVQPG
jgi:hypothetical protein